MLEVLPVCSPSIQRQLIGILPEVAAPQDHGVVLEQLQSLLEADVTFMAPVVECLGNMMLDTAVQVRRKQPKSDGSQHLAEGSWDWPAVAAAQQPQQRQNYRHLWHRHQLQHSPRRLQLMAS
jgi:hypothetical protein